MARGADMSKTGSAEFHCWYAADRQSALRKGQALLETYKCFLRPGPVCDLGWGEAGLLLALRELGCEEISGVDSNPELCSLAESFGLPVTRIDLGDICVLSSSKLECISIWTSLNMSRLSLICWS